MKPIRTHDVAPGTHGKPSIGSEPHLGTRKRLLERLKRGAAWTMDLRREPERYGANPADGVYELRKHGWDIRTLRAWIYDKEGQPLLFEDFYVLVRGSKFNYGLQRWEGGKPVLREWMYQRFHAALLKAWEREP